jgi:hypothetical protein
MGEGDPGGETLPVALLIFEKNLFQKREFLLDRTFWQMYAADASGA